MCIVLLSVITLAGVLVLQVGNFQLHSEFFYMTCYLRMLLISLWCCLGNRLYNCYIPPLGVVCTLVWGNAQHQCVKGHLPTRDITIMKDLIRLHLSTNVCVCPPPRLLPLNSSFRYQSWVPGFHGNHIMGKKYEDWDSRLRCVTLSSQSVKNKPELVYEAAQLHTAMLSTSPVQGGHTIVEDLMGSIQQVCVCVKVHTSLRQSFLQELNCICTCTADQKLHMWLKKFLAAMNIPPHQITKVLWTMKLGPYLALFPGSWPATYFRHYSWIVATLKYLSWLIYMAHKCV